MIRLTRLMGDRERFSLNPDLIEKIEAHPDTVITLVDDTRYLVAESEDEVNRLIRDFRAAVLFTAQQMASGAYRPPANSFDDDGTVVPFPRRGGE